MNKFILFFVSSVMLLACAQKSNEKLGITEKINQDILQSPSAAGGYETKYYVCDDGDDSNNGLSEDTPVQSMTKAMRLFSTMAAGDSLLFCQGGEFPVNEAAYISNLNCDRDNHCIIDSYYSQTKNSSEMPVIFKGTVGGALIRFEDGGGADHDEGYIIRNIEFSGDGQKAAFLFFNDVDDVLIENISFKNFKRIAWVDAGRDPSEGSDTLNERIEFNGIRLNKVPELFAGPQASNVTIEGVEDVSNSVALVLPSGNAPTKYYVCDNGDDSNNGTSVFAPWASFDYAILKFESMPAGASISFCDGGEFNSSFPRIVNYNCRADKKCAFQTYSSPTKSSDAAPIIYGNTDGAFNFQDGGASNRDEGYKVLGLHLIGMDNSGRGVVLMNDVDSVEIDSVVIDGFAIGVYSTNSGNNEAGSDGINTNIEIKNSIIKNNLHQGILGGADNWLIDNNKIFHNGFEKAIFLHNIYISSSNNKNIVISNNKLSKNASVDGQCKSVSLVVHGKVDGLTIVNNNISEDEGAGHPLCWGIAIDTGYAGVEEVFKNVVIENNVITNVGGVGIGCTSCINVSIKGNVINHSHADEFHGIRIPSKNLGENDIRSDNISIVDNEFYLLKAGEYSKQALFLYNIESSATLVVEGNYIQ